MTWMEVEKRVEVEVRVGPLDKKAEGKDSHLARIRVIFIDE